LYLSGTRLVVSSTSVPGSSALGIFLPVGRMLKISTRYGPGLRPSDWPRRKVPSTTSADEVAPCPCGMNVIVPDSSGEPSRVIVPSTGKRRKPSAPPHPAIVRNPTSSANAGG
jgi:hypothetical protein